MDPNVNPFVQTSHDLLRQGAAPEHMLVQAQKHLIALRGLDRTKWEVKLAIAQIKDHIDELEQMVADGK